MHARRQAVTARLNFKSLETKTTVSKRTHADAHEQEGGREQFASRVPALGAERERTCYCGT